MFGFGKSKAQIAAAQRAAEEAQAEAEYKAYWAGRLDERREIANYGNVQLPVTAQEIAGVMSSHISKRATPVMPKRRA